MDKMRFALIFVLIMCGLAGCATVAPVTPASPQGPQAGGVYHRIKEGQALWSVARLYNLDLDELVRANHISDSASIETGQVLFIPQHSADILASFEPMPREDFNWPLQGKVIALYGQFFERIINKGINIAPFDNYEVYASRGGKVVFCADDFNGFNKTIIIDHGDGFITVYAKISQLMVKPGDIVSTGDTIAKIAPDSGHLKGGYLHFEIRKGHLPQNPRFYLRS